MLQRIFALLEYSVDCSYSNPEIWVRVLGLGHMHMRSRLTRGVNVVLARVSMCMRYGEKKAN